MTWRLEIQRSSVTAKCANCSWWLGKGSDAPAAMCTQHDIKTLDLGVCTGWRGQAQEEHEIMEPEICGPDTD